MQRTTLGSPNDENTARAYVAGNDGTSHEVLVLVAALELRTPQKTICSPHIEVGSSHINDVAYCLGLYRTTLPGNLGMNSLLIGPSRMPSIDTGSQGLGVYHHTAKIPCFTASAFLIPSSQSAVVVMTNSLPLMDPTELIGQSILSLLLGEQVPADLPKLSERACAASLASQLANRETPHPSQSPLAAYEGDCYNIAENSVLPMTVCTPDLLMIVQGIPQTRYNPLPYDGDTFCWPADREDELCGRGVWPFTAPGWYKIVFGTSDNAGIDHLAWKHDPSAKPEIFQKLRNISEPKRNKL